ncbi:MAG: YceI family protein [Acidimicrobiales bacterium]
MTRFAIDPQRSRVWIDARSSLHPIHSEVTGVTGWFEADVQGGGRVNPTVPVRAHVELDVANLSSGNALYDREMRRRINARQFPTISGDIDTMKENDQGRYSVSGLVTFRGESRPATGEVALSMSEDRSLRIEGSHTFDVRDFGMEPPRILTLRVYPDVDVKVAFVAREEGS